MIVLANLSQLLSFKKARLMLGFFILFIGCESPRELIEINGHTMGTTYSIKLVHHSRINQLDLISDGIDSILVSLNQQMSTWDPNSEISKFNRLESIDPVPVSESFATVVQSALDISKETDGYFDIAIFDLMQEWGFGPNPKSKLPTAQIIESILNYSGYHQIEVINNTIVKKHPNNKIDLNAIAKGYGVDEVFHYLKLKGYKDVFVEIGGEVRCSGLNQQNTYWSIGIQNPTGDDSDNNPIAGVIYSDNDAIATSGNYRNFVNVEGEIIGHTINPKTGFPIQTDVLSVTVQAASCMVADAWATALMTLDFKNGFSLVKKYPDLNVIWIIEEEGGARRLAKTTNANVEDSIYETLK